MSSFSQLHTVYSHFVVLIVLFTQMCSVAFLFSRVVAMLFAVSNPPDLNCDINNKVNLNVTGASLETKPGPSAGRETPLAGWQKVLTGPAPLNAGCQLFFNN